MNAFIATPSSIHLVAVTHIGDSALPIIRQHVVDIREITVRWSQSFDPDGVSWHIVCMTQASLTRISFCFCHPSSVAPPPAVDLQPETRHV